MALTSIEWTATLAPDGKLRAGYTFNPWWGCIRVSPGCEHCYAESQAKRYGHDIWGPASTTPRRFFGDKHWSEPLKWNRDALALGMRLKVFCASFADVFEDNDSLIPHRERLWEVIAETPQLDWLVLTKRTENIREMMPDRLAERLAGHVGGKPALLQHARPDPHREHQSGARAVRVGRAAARTDRPGRRLRSLVRTMPPGARPRHSRLLYRGLREGRLRPDHGTGQSQPA
jgi:hypothetical protein